MDPFVAVVLIGVEVFAYLGWVAYLFARVEAQSERLQHNARLR